MVFRPPPLLVGVILVVLFALFVRRLDVLLHLFGRDPQIHRVLALDALGKRRMDINFYAVLHDDVGTATDEHARPLPRQLFDERRLRNVDLVGHGHLVIGIQSARKDARRALLVVLHELSGEVAVIRRHGDEVFIVKGNPQFLGELDAELPAAAAELTADRDDFIHVLSPFRRHFGRALHSFSTIILTAKEEICQDSFENFYLFSEGVALLPPAGDILVAQIRRMNAVRRELFRAEF